MADKTGVIVAGVIGAGLIVFLVSQKKRGKYEAGDTIVYLGVEYLVTDKTKGFYQLQNSSGQVAWFKIEYVDNNISVS